MPALVKIAWFLFALTASWMPMEPLPKPLTNNAIAGFKDGDLRVYYSFMGMGQGRTYKDVTRESYVYSSLTRKWETMLPVPGSQGRLAAQAYASITGVVVFGGYTVAEDGTERTLSNVDIYVPADKKQVNGYWAKGVNMPIAVDDAVVGGLDEFHIYLVSGWSNDDCVNNVQIYDPRKDRWQQGTPIPGRPVFGHAGAVVDDYIVYLGGAYKNPDAKGVKYLASDEAWLGKINKSKPTEIAWTKLPPFPSKARYRIAAGAFKHRVIFAGGTDNPYNYNGIGYDGKPAEPIATTFAFNVKTKEWETLPDDPYPTMDHRRLVNDGQGMVNIGGMEKGQKVTAHASHLYLEGK